MRLHPSHIWCGSVYRHLKTMDHKLPAKIGRENVLNLSEPTAVPRQKYIRPRLNFKSCLRQFVHPSPHFHGGSKSAQFGIVFDHPVALTCLSFEMEEHIGKLILC